MVYQSTSEVVRRVLPLLEQMATRTIDKARLLQYLSASAAVDWGVMDLVAEDTDEQGRLLTYRDRVSGSEQTLRYPDVLPAELDALVVAEYKRLAVAKPLTLMNQDLFTALFGLTHCARCRWRGEEHTQVHRECWYAGHPVNFEAE